MFFREKRIPQETFQSSVRFLENELAKNSKNVDALIDLAYLYNHRAKSDHEDAELFAMKAIELAPNEKAAWVAYQESLNALCGDEWYDNHFEVIRFCEDVLETQWGRDFIFW